MDDRHHPPVDPARFWAKVELSDDCWEWTGVRHPTKRYGEWLGRPRLRNKAAHRLAFELANGPIPAGMHVLHHCDNPPCVRPDHLFLGTNADNVADRQAKGRGARGERNGLHRLTEDDVRTIRLLRARGMVLRQIANAAGVSPTTIRRVLIRDTWSHVA